jgi:hypothetical protein
MSNDVIKRITSLFFTGILAIAIVTSASDTIPSSTSSSIGNDVEPVAVKKESIASVNSTDSPELDKVPARSTWEYFVSGPIWVLTSPVTVSLYGISQLGGYVNQTGIGMKIYNVLVSPDGTRSLFPYVSTQTGAGLELQKKGLVSPESKLTLLASGWTLGRGSALLSFDKLETRRNLPLFGAAARYYSIPAERFFGIGNKTMRSDSSFYSFRDIDAGITLGKNITPDFSVYVTPAITSYQSSDAKGNHGPQLADVFSLGEVPGAGKTMVAGGMSSGAEYGHYDNTVRPSAGFFTKAKTGMLDQIDAPRLQNESRMGYWFFETEAGVIAPMPWGPHRMLLLRGDLRTAREYRDREIPYYLLSEVGSESTVRGFVDRRFIDNDRIVLSGEYHYPAWTTQPITIDVILFCDAGQVANDIFTDFSARGFHGSGGIGLRMHSKKNVIGQFLVGFSREGFRLFLNKGIYP